MFQSKTMDNELGSIRTPEVAIPRSVALQVALVCGFECVGVRPSSPLASHSFTASTMAAFLCLPMGSLVTYASLSVG